MNTKQFKINIQLFAEGDPAPDINALQDDVLAMLKAEGEPPVEPPVDPAQTLQSPIEPGQPNGEPIQQEPPVQPATVQPEPQPPQQSQNEIMLMQQLQQMQQAMVQQQQQFQQFMQQSMTQQPQQPPQLQKSQEEVEAEKQALVEQMMTDPMAVIQQAIQQAVNPLQKEIQGYKEKEMWGTAKNHFAKMVDQTTGQPMHPDYDSVAERIEQIMQERPWLMNTQKPLYSLKDAYDIAIAEKIKSQPQVQQPPVNFVDMAKDPNNIKQILSNPEIMKAIAAAQAAQQGQLNQQVPPIAASPGAANAAPYIQPKPNSYKDLDSQTLAELKQGLI